MRAYVLYSSPYALLASPKLLDHVDRWRNLAYMVAACLTMVVMAVVCGGLGVSEPRVAPWLIGLLLALFVRFSFSVFRFAKSQASKGIIEPAGFEVIVRQESSAGDSGVCATNESGEDRMK